MEPTDPSNVIDPDDAGSGTADHTDDSATDIPADHTSDQTAGGPDLDHIGRQLADVESALERLDAGTYWSDEVTSEPIADHILEADPLARRASS